MGVWYEVGGKLLLAIAPSTRWTGVGTSGHWDGAECIFLTCVITPET